jgi:hypothetical protein
MKIHFIGDLEGEKSDYEQIILSLERLGHDIITRHSLERHIEDVKKESPKQSEAYAKKMHGWIARADVIVVEVSYPGLGSGFEVAQAVDLGKPVVVLYRPEVGDEPFVLRAMEQRSEKVQVLSYSKESMMQVLKMALDYAAESNDTRFNFFISPNQQNYLDWISKNKRIPRAVYLRNLIEKAMEADEEYSG